MSKVAKSTQEISDNPSKNAVTMPQNGKFKEEDINRKISFYGVIQAFKEGRMPDNQQIFDALTYAERNSPVDTSKLSKDGQVLIQDARDIIASLRKIVAEKNANQEIQEFIHATVKADYKGSTGMSAPISQDEAKKDAETAGEAFRTLFKLFLRNGEARKLFNDLGLIGRDVFADAAQFTAGKIRPDEEKLASVDHPAPANEFHDDIPQALKPKSKEEKEAAKLEVEADKKRAAANGDPNPELTAQVNRIPEEHKELIREHKDKTVNYLKENFPEERRDQFIYRLKKILVECQRHPDYRDAIEFFLTAAENYKSVANDIHTQVENNAKSVANEGNISHAQRSFRKVLERFANGRSTQPIVDALDVLYNDCAKDPELKQYFKSIDQFVRRCVQEPGFVMKDEANNQAKQLRTTGKKFFTGINKEDKGKYEDHFKHFFEEVKVFFQAMGEDPTNVEFGEKWHKLGRDVFFNAEGKATFKPHLWDDIRDPILPQLLRHVGFVPIPRIEFSDPMVDLVIENLNIDPANIIPNLIEIEAHHFHRMSAFKKITDNHKGSVKILLSQIQTDLRDVAWSINKKKGFPSLKDSGVADVFLGGQGLTVSVTLETQTGTRDVFKVKQVKAKIHKIDFAIRKSKHDVLVKIMRPLAASLIKKQLCKLTENGIRDGLEKVNDHLVAAKEAEEGKKLDTLKNRFSKSESGSQKPSAGTFKLATSKRNSILPKMGSPDGWINKLDQTEKKALESGGQDKPNWYSPAFSIVPPQKS